MPEANFQVQEPNEQEKQTPQETQPQSSPQLGVEYRTRIIYIDKLNETIVSVQAPVMGNPGVLQFLLKDRLIIIPLGQIRRWEIEQLSFGPKIITDIHEK